MILVDLDGVETSRPGRVLFSDVSVTVSEGDRLGVVGINGTGKSTLLQVMDGTLEPDGGSVRRGRGVSIATLAQVTKLDGATVREAVGGQWRGESVLDRLGMAEHFDTPIDQLSGGQEKRTALARALVADADLLILDEPTNHLDVDAIEWLEGELARFRGGLVIVTHDRHVLDKVATRIVELDRGKSYIHEGGYSAYLLGRAEREERNAASESTRRNLARRELAWLKRGAPARTRKSKSRVERATNLIESGPEAEARAGDLDLATLHEGTPRLGDQVIELHDVTVGYEGSPPLISDLTLALDRRERLGIVGPNGGGKTTLLKVLAGTMDPVGGHRVVGPTVNLGVNDQMGRALDPTARVRQLVAGDRAQPDWWDAQLLERFWFDSDAQKAEVSMLSGGERRRLQLVLTLAAKPNVLLLDEPTNDLDLDTLRALEDFLEDWPGAAVVVSHDRAFLERTVDDVLVVDNGRAQRWPGGHEAWLEHRRSGSSVPASANASTKIASAPDRDSKGKTQARSGAQGRSASSIRADLKSVEKSMVGLDKRKARLHKALIDAADDHAQLADLGRELTDAESEIATTEERWLELSTELDERQA